MWVCSSYVSAYAYVAGVLSCSCLCYAYACAYAYALVKTSLNVWLCASQQRERVKVRGIKLAPRNSKVVLALVFVLVVKSEGR